LSLIYKLLPASEWRAAQAGGVFKGSGIDLADGYIHFSTGRQAQETARRYFAGVEDLMLLTIEADDLGPGLKWEPSRGGNLFPHLYGDLALDKVLEAKAIALDEAGIPVLGTLA
jgi:uncharacterized protein (DUF952 family)